MAVGDPNDPYAPPSSQTAEPASETSRKPWLAVLLAFVSTPLAMLYVVRPWRALGYLSVTFAGIVIAFQSGGHAWLNAALLVPVGSIALSLVAAVDAYRLALVWDGRRLPWYSRPRGLIGVFLAGTAAIMSFRVLLIEPFKIPSGSMEPTLRIGDVILVDKQAYGWSVPFTTRRLATFATPARGDVAVFRYPPNPELDYVKRIVGVPGDRVAYRDKRLAINGHELQVTADGAEQILDARGRLLSLRRSVETLDGKQHRILIDPEQPDMRAPPQAFLGQDRCSYDARGFECTVPAGHYFAMGDNRDYASDSRYWGFVPESHFVGRVTRIWHSSRDSSRAGKAVE
jgi:signal peptidase I